MTRFTSNVGRAQTYEDGDQRPHPGDAAEATPYKEGQPHSHNILDSKDERSIANKLAAAERQSDDSNEKTITDPLAPAQNHGHEPSRGAKVDAELQAEEEELLRRKGKA